MRWMENKMLEKIEKILKSVIKDFMMEKMGNLLKPLDHWNMRLF